MKNTKNKKNIKINNLIKIHNCYKCHKNIKKINKNYYPKIKKQYKNYIFWSINQYKTNYSFIFNRKNFLMRSQIQNISNLDIKNIINYIKKL